MFSGEKCERIDTTFSNTYRKYYRATKSCAASARDDDDSSKNTAPNPNILDFDS